MPSGKCIGALIPCFIDGNTHTTIPYKFKNSESWDRHPPIPSWIAVSASADTQLERQQTVRGESLAVALRTRPAQDDVHRRGRGCQAGSNQRGKEKGRRDQKTPQGGGTGSQRACSGSLMKTFVAISHMMSHMISHYDISI